MDNTQNNGMNPQPAADAAQPVSQPQDASAMPATDMGGMQQMASMGDVAGMTPPPAPISMPDPMQAAMPQPAPVATADPAPVVSSMDTTSMSPSVPSSPMGDMGSAMPAAPEPAADLSSSMPAPAAPSGQPGETDDYAYAEDLLDEILDSLDRIEAKLEAIEKKVGQ